MQTAVPTTKLGKMRLMKNKAYDAQVYSFQANESIIVDANIWLYLQPPATQPTPQWAIAYTAVFSKLIKSKAHILIDSHILSEYINRYLRIEYNGGYKYSYKDFKVFRCSADGRKIAQQVVSEIQNILNFARPIDTLLSKFNMLEIMNEIQKGAIDFNDGIIVENCQMHGSKLLTNDGDMTVGGIEVLTTNAKLLQACP